MKSIRNIIALAVYSIVLVGGPMLHQASTAVPSQPGYQMICTGSHCGTCC